MIKSSFHRRCLAASFAGWTFAFSHILYAETVILQPVADTSLHEIFPKNNFGAFAFVHGGVTGKNTRTRALFRFDLTDSVPEGARVISASLEVTVVFAAPALEVPELEFDLHHLLTAWGEGNKDAGGGLSGRLASDGEATWDYAMNPLAWQTPGGQAGMDFAASASSTAVIGGVASYTFPSTPELIADVQHWLENPGGNFGWILKSRTEDVLQSAKRFGSSESGNAPVLTIEYSIGTSELIISSIEVADGQILLGWNGGTAPYQVQSRANLSESAWTDLGEPTASTQAEFPADGSINFFRVVSVQ